MFLIIKELVELLESCEDIFKIYLDVKKIQVPEF